MLMALCFEPSRFFLKGKVRQKKQATYIKHTERGEVGQVWNEHWRCKKQSQVLVLGPHKRALIMNRGCLAGGRDCDISEKQWVREGCKTKPTKNIIFCVHFTPDQLPLFQCVYVFSIHFCLCLNYQFHTFTLKNCCGSPNSIDEAWTQFY